MAPQVVVALIVTGCGGRAPAPSIEPEASSPPSSPVTVTAPPTTEPVGTTVDVVLATSTTAPTDPTTAPRAGLALLRPDGLGTLDFGAPADGTIAELSAMLGPPDRLVTIAPIGPGEDGCVEGASWLDCLRDLRIVDSGRLAVWEDEGLEVALVDTTGAGWPPERTELHFADWQATVGSGGVRLTTSEGLYAGITLGELERVVGDVEFACNEGLLDSYVARVPGAGAYWGRLDWDPTTVEIEPQSVAAVQAALDEHGAALVVDGEWGPRTEAAWIDFLSAHGFETSTTQLWLTPEVGEALGLPPDDVTVATIEPRPRLGTPDDSTWAQAPTLRPDGLGLFDFGASADDLVPQLASLLGPPAEDTSYTPDGPGPFEYLPLGYRAAYDLRVVAWDDPSLSLVLSDVPFLGDRFGEPTPGTPTLVSWSTTSSRLTTSDGLAVGSSLVELEARSPAIVLGTFGVCETQFDPAGFVTVPFDGDAPPLWRGLRGTLDWDWVSDLQRALDARGATLAVDGQYGPRTRAAVTTFQEELGLAVADGLVDAETALALGLRAPDDARIASLAAGHPGSC